MVPSEFVEDLPDDVDEPLPIVLPELLVDGLVVLVDDDDGVLPVPVVVGIVVVVPDVPVVLLLEGVVVLVLLEGVVVVVVVLLDGVVVVLELELDCAIAAPPPINNDAAAMAVVVFKNEPMVMTPDVVDTKARRSAVCQQCAMSDATLRKQRMCPDCHSRGPRGHHLFPSGCPPERAAAHLRTRHADCSSCPQ